MSSLSCGDRRRLHRSDFKDHQFTAFLARSSVCGPLCEQDPGVQSQTGGSGVSQSAIPAVTFHTCQTEVSAGVRSFELRFARLQRTRSLDLNDWVGVIVGGEASAQENHGRFEGEVQAERLPDGRRMRLCPTSSSRDGVVSACKGGRGRSLDTTPALVKGWVPLYWKLPLASVIHDVACQLRERTWEVSHLAFHYGIEGRWCR